MAKIIVEGAERDMTPNEILLSQIQTLEATVTERRVREAVLGVDNGWLKNLNDQIAALRAQMTRSE